MFRAQPIYCLPWLLVGGTWTVQLFVPWTASGPLATASMMDVVGLLRQGTLGPAVPAWALPAVLAMPVAGLALVAGSAFDGVVAQWARGLIAAVGIAVAVAVIQGLVGNQLSRLGPGGYLTLCGVGCALCGVLTDQRGSRQKARQVGQEQQAKGWVA